MPGQASLHAQKYYAHPRNAFWPILIAVTQSQVPSFDAAQQYSYPQRCSLAAENGFAIWDVLEQCTRPGSLDSKIVRSTEVPNDIASLAMRHPELKKIICNGKTAEALFKRHISKTLNCLRTNDQTTTVSIRQQKIELITLPSTSPAMASLALVDKYQVWAEGLLG